MNYLKISEPDDLLANRQYPKTIEYQLVNYIISLRESGISYSTIKVLTASLYTYYELNDVTINRRRIAKYLPEMNKVARDEAYTTEAITQAITNADHRMRMVVLILASTGCRIGSLPGLVLRDLTKIPEHDIYRITFYQGTRSEYYTFTTRECAITGIDNYLNYRQRCGEKLSFNQNTNRWEPDNTPLIRIQFDINDGLQVNKPRPMKLDGLRMALTYHMIKSGLRSFEHITENSNVKRIRKPVSLANGFRKHVISTFIEAQLNHEIRELLVDHATMLDQNYFRPTEDQVLQEYLKAESLLTIDPSLRLQNEIQTLKVEKNSWEELRKEVDSLKELLKPK